MRNKIKRSAILITIGVIVLSVFGLVKYLDMRLGFAAGTGHTLTLRVPNLTYLSWRLDGCVYQFNIEGICIAGLGLLLLVSRVLLIRRAVD